MMWQNIVVYLIILLALGGAGRYLYRKLRNLKKKNQCSVCTDCPLKEGCKKKQREEGGVKG